MGLDVPAGEGSAETGFVTEGLDCFAGERLGEAAVEVAAGGGLGDGHAADPLGGGGLGARVVLGVETVGLLAVARVAVAVLGVLLQGDADGVGREVERVHDPCPGGLEVALGRDVVERDVRAVAVHEIGGLADGAGHLAEAAVGSGRGWPGGGGQAAAHRSCGRVQPGDGLVALGVAGDVVLAGEAVPEVVCGRDESRPGVEDPGSVVASDVHEEMARGLVDVVEQLADGADVAGGQRDLCGVEERVVDVGVAEAAAGGPARP
ncbi:hypothetical protein C7S10_18995 [Nocardioides currus]|uniref:Uncharacterized protein n=1 Tax=Nocardioides currus TaxID=2133958 RepID=A0A2R7YU97_9ACTN|nr:hypothetical protein C7S10_18995 [Nocardioides currus]